MPRAASSDIPLILELLSLTPHALPQSEAGIQQNIDSDFVFVGNRCAVRLCPEDGHVEVAWWLWDGTDKPAHRTFHYDFARLLESRFRVHPFDVERPEGVELEILHTDQQRKLIRNYVRQYTTSLIGLGRILLRANMNRLYRTVRYSGPEGAVAEAVRLPKEVLAKTDRLGGNLKA